MVNLFLVGSRIENSIDLDKGCFCFEHLGSAEEAVINLTLFERKKRNKCFDLRSLEI